MSEYYNWDFLKLVNHLGYDKAVEKVHYYQSLSKQFISCKTYVIHHCQLLTTYQNPQPPAQNNKIKITDLTDSGLWDYAKHRGLNEKWYENQIKQRLARRAKMNG